MKQPHDQAISLRVSVRDRAKLVNEAGRVRESVSMVGRAALRIGLAMIKEDPSLLLRGAEEDS